MFSRVIGLEEYELNWLESQWDTSVETLTYLSSLNVQAWKALNNSLSGDNND